MIKLQKVIMFDVMEILMLEYSISMSFILDACELVLLGYKLTQIN